jgi:TatD DNase family protein
MQPPLIDTHCHLDPGHLEDAADDVLQRASAEGVRTCVCIGVGGLGEARYAVALAERRDNVVATVGVHPHDAARDGEALEADLREMLDNEKVVAVGEIGLDYHYDHSPREVQKSVFRRYIAVAREVGLPIVVHTRSAPADTLAVLSEEKARDVGGVIHCFSEDIEFARRALDLGFVLSFSGIVTFKRAQAIQQTARWAPDDCILIETDSPYLAPVPKRGKKNEPAYLRHTAEFLAELRMQPMDTVAEYTSRNAQKLFGSALARAVELSQTP